MDSAEVPWWILLCQEPRGGSALLPTLKATILGGLSNLYTNIAILLFTTIFAWATSHVYEIIQGERPEEGGDGGNGMPGNIVLLASIKHPICSAAQPATSI